MSFDGLTRRSWLTGAAVVAAEVGTASRAEVGLDPFAWTLEEAAAAVARGAWCLRLIPWTPVVPSREQWRTPLPCSNSWRATIPCMLSLALNRCRTIRGRFSFRSHIYGWAYRGSIFLNSFTRKFLRRWKTRYGIYGQKCTRSAMPLRPRGRSPRMRATMSSCIIVRSPSSTNLPNCITCGRSGY